MSNIAYTQDQVMAALKKQGYTTEEAEKMAKAIGPVDKQDSNIVPNIAEAVPFAAGSYYMNKWFPDKEGVKPFFGKGVLKTIPGGILGSLAYTGASALTGNNYAEKASGGQMLGDITGGIAGGMLGETAGAAAGRALGGTLGLVGGPIGSIAGGVLGSWLVPKLFNNADENYLEPDKGLSTETKTALAGAGLLATPLGRPVRSLIGKAIPDQIKEPVSSTVKGIKDTIAETDIGKAYLEPFAKRAANPEVRRPGPEDSPWGWNSLTNNMGDTVTHVKSINNTMEQLGKMAGEWVKKQRQAQRPPNE